MLKYDKTYSYEIDKYTYPFSYFNPTITGFGKQKKTPKHKHSCTFLNEYTLQYISSGEGIYKVNGKEYHLKEGDLFYLPKNVPVFYAANRNNPYEYYWVAFDGNGVESFIKNLGLSVDNPVKNYNDARITKIMKTIGNYLNEYSNVGFMNASGEILKLFALLLSHNEQNVQKTETVTDFYVSKAVMIIKNNYNDGELNVTSIAEKIGLGRNYFSTIFAEKTGVTPINYLMNYRITQAKKLLELGHSVTDVAFNCGFNSSANFSFQFKNITGISPIKYRLNNKKITLS